MELLFQLFPHLIWGLHWSWKNYGVKIDFGNSAKIFAASAIASIVTYLLIGFLNFTLFFILLIGFVVFMVVYLAVAPLIGAVNQTDIDNFKNMFSSLGIIAKILDLPLLFMRKMCKVKNSKNAQKQ